MLSWWQYKAILCRYAIKSILVEDSGHWSAICFASLSFWMDKQGLYVKKNKILYSFTNWVPASDILLAASITAIVVCNDPRP